MQNVVSFIGLFCKRDLLFKEPTNRSYPVGTHTRTHTHFLSLMRTHSHTHTHTCIHKFAYISMDICIYLYQTFGIAQKCLCYLRQHFCVIYIYTKCTWNTHAWHTHCYLRQHFVLFNATLLCYIYTKCTWNTHAWHTHCGAAKTALNVNASHRECHKFQIEHTKIVLHMNTIHKNSLKYKNNTKVLP